jgi:signal transduction histidine kinase
VIDESMTGLERIERTVRGLLGLSRTASDRVGVCDLNEVVAEAARFASLDGDATVRLEARLADGLPPVEAASDQLVQVVLNLFLNAKQALRNSPDATIVATTAANGPWVEVRVADDGPGVPESIRGRIFDPFFTTRNPNEGTGLGLPIAFDIVRQHGGTLEVESPESGGACFVVRLPARAPVEAGS